MEGYLIRLPACAWSVDDDDATATTIRNRRARRSYKPQARLLYYILGEGFLDGFASPDDVEPVESFQLTSFEVDVDPVYSMLMFKVTTREKRPVAISNLPPTAHLTSDTSDEEDDDDNEASSPRASAAGASLLLFASDKVLVEAWCKKLLNWNRYVFAGAPSTGEVCDLVHAKSELITAFHEKNNLGMFSLVCQLQDCTATEIETPAVVTRTVSSRFFTDRFQPPRLPLPLTAPVPTPITNDKLQQSVVATLVGPEIKPLWMLLHHGSSRRVRSVPMTK